MKTDSNHSSETCIKFTITSSKILALMIFSWSSVIVIVEVHDTNRYENDPNHLYSPTHLWKVRLASSLNCSIILFIEFLVFSSIKKENKKENKTTKKFKRSCVKTSSSADRNQSEPSISNINHQIRNVIYEQRLYTFPSLFFSLIENLSTLSSIPSPQINHSFLRSNIH